MSQPPIFAATPLALTSVAIQIGVSALTIISGFNEIAKQKATGVRAAAEVFIEAQRSLVWGLLEFAACVVVAGVFAAAMISIAKESTPILQSSASPRTLAWSAGALFGIGLLVWYHGNTVDLCMAILDPKRFIEAAKRLGTTNLEDVATIIARRLAIAGLSAKFAMVALIAIGFRSFNPVRPRRPNFAASILLATIALCWCGLNMAIDFRNIKYLQSIGVRATRDEPPPPPLE
jgi:hypothetical protein